MVSLSTPTLLEDTWSSTLEATTTDGKLISKFQVPQTGWICSTSVPSFSTINILFYLLTLTGTKIHEHIVGYNYYQYRNPCSTRQCSDKDYSTVCHECLWFRIQILFLQNGIKRDGHLVLKRFVLTHIRCFVVCTIASRVHCWNMFWVTATQWSSGCYPVWREPFREGCLVKGKGLRADNSLQVSCDRPYLYILRYRSVKGGSLNWNNGLAVTHGFNCNPKRWDMGLSFIFSQNARHWDSTVGHSSCRTKFGFTKWICS